MRGWTGEEALSRRNLLPLLASLGLAGRSAWPQSASNLTLTGVPGIRVGHWTHESGSTGCTAVLTTSGAVAGVDVRGGGPGTREIELLKPEMSVDAVHAVVLSGGSAYGLAAADGVMRYLEQEGIGFRVGENIVPIVPAAILFDLGVGNPDIRPGAGAGFHAAETASDDAVVMGSIGAGAGATVGKMSGMGRAMRGGLGSAAISIGDGLVVGALAVVNALGDVVDPGTGRIVAGVRREDGSGFSDSMELLRSGRWNTKPVIPGNTTLGVVAANVTWSKAQATKVAQMAHDGLALTIRPAHMPFDGDTIFALGTGGRPVDPPLLGVVGALAADALAEAVLAGVRAAQDGFGFPAASRM